MPVFGVKVAGIELVGVDGGGGTRVAGGVGEGGLGVVERRVHEHRKSVRKLLGSVLCSIVARIGRTTASLELAGGGEIGRRRLGGFEWVSGRA